MKEDYQKTYDIANGIIKKQPRTTLNHLIIETIHKLGDSELYASKAALQCWADNKKRLVSKDWLLNYCNGWDTPDYDILIQSVQHWNGLRLHDVETLGEYLFINGQDASGSIPPEVWYHLAIAEDMQIQNPPTTFSCSC